MEIPTLPQIQPKSNLSEGKMNLQSYNEILRRKLTEKLAQKASWGRRELELAFEKILSESVEEYYNQVRAK